MKYSNKIKTGVWASIKFIFAFYVFLCFFLWAVQNYIIYKPTHDVREPASYTLEGVQVLSLQNAHQEKLQAWYAPAKDNLPTVVYFHGNGGHLGHRATYFKKWIERGYGIFAIDYRGYGASEGSVSEQNLYDDARLALNYVKDTLKIPAEKTIIYGESLGTGIVIDVADEYKAALLVLTSPFTSMVDLAKIRYPFAPSEYLLSERFMSIQKMGAIKMPVLVLHGTADDLVPVEQGKTIFEAAHEPKKVIYYEGKGHRDMSQTKKIKDVIAFCKELGII